MNTPYFPQWRAQMAALGRRVEHIQRHSAADMQWHCQAFLPKGFLRRTPKGAGSRCRVFFLERVFWCFVWQMLQPHTACRAVVRQVQAFSESAHRIIDESTSAYCQARRRLPRWILRRALQESAQSAERLCPQGVPGWSRPIKVVDSTCITLPDTSANRQAYGYPRGPKPGCGFPVMKVLALFSLTTGAILKIVRATWSVNDLRLGETLWPSLRPGDILLADRAFCAFALLSRLLSRGVDVVCRLHQARPINPQSARRISPNEWLVTWPGDKAKAPYLTPEQRASLPMLLTVRIIRSRLYQRGFRTCDIWICTTLLDPIAYPAERIAMLYLRRWELELCFRDLKTTMGMETLHCRSPAMVYKELLCFLIAHNFIRCLITEAAGLHQTLRTRISFKGAIDAARSFHQAIRSARSRAHAHQLRLRLLHILALDLLPLRPGRTEPRAVKRRPNSYQRLTTPRHIFKEIPHRTRYHAPRPPLS